jgi:Pectate lyase superfamily protein/Right handed beta helix region
MDRRRALRRFAGLTAAGAVSAIGSASHSSAAAPDDLRRWPQLLGKVDASDVGVKKVGRLPAKTVQDALAELDVRRPFFDVRDDYGGGVAKGDGANDDRAAIQAVIDAAGDRGGGIVYLPPGTFVVTLRSGSGPDSLSCLELRNGVSLVGAGQDATTIKLASAGYNDDVYVVRARRDTSDVSVEDLTIDGNQDGNQQSEHQHGIFLERVARAAIRGVSLLKAWGDGIYLHDGATQALIEECRIEQNHRNAITVNGEISHVRIQCNTIIGRAAAIDFETGSPGFDFSIEANYILMERPAEYAVSLAGGDRVRFLNNYVQQGGVFIYGCSRSVVADNSVEAGTDRCIHVYRRVEGGAIVQSNFLHTEGREAILVVGTPDLQPTHVVIDGNIIDQRSTSWAVAVEGARGVQIVRNRILGNGTAQGGVRVRSTLDLDSAVISDNYFENLGGPWLDATATRPFRILTATNNTVTDTQDPPTTKAYAVDKSIGSALVENNHQYPTEVR